MLVARALARHEEKAVRVAAARGLDEKAGSGRGIEALDLREVHVELHLGSHLVHVLAARARGAGGAQMERQGGNNDAGGDTNGLGHGVPEPRRIPLAASTAAWYRLRRSPLRAGGYLEPRVFPGALALLIQTVGIALIAVLSFFLARSIRRVYLDYWSRAWATLAVPLAMLFVAYRFPASRPLAELLYYLRQSRRKSAAAEG